MQWRKIVVSSSSCHIARRILCWPDVNYETESWLRYGLPSLVDPSTVEEKRSMIPELSGFENGQLDNRLVEERRRVLDLNSAVERRERLGGVLNYYERRVA
jgi:hypothetical protein